ncbi:MAG: PepSY domain-containing protein [Gammaproteobacteria bacterium]
MKKLVILSGVVLAFTTGLVLAEDVPQQSLPMTSIIQDLSKEGFIGIHSIKFDDGAYKVEGITKTGSEAKVSVDPQSGLVRKVSDKDKGHLNIMDATKKIENAGYRKVYQIEQTDKGFEAKALDKEGKTVNIKVDGITGSISKGSFF